MDLTRRQTPDIAAGEKIGRRPITSFSNVGIWPPADFRTVVRPNFGPPCSSPWLDLSAGPVVVPVPDTDGRFRLMPMLEMWTGIFAAPGWRTAAEIFACAADLMQVIPPHLTDAPIPARLQRIGFGPGAVFDLAAADPVRARRQPARGRGLSRQPS